MLRLREITDSYPRTRLNNKFDARLLSVTPSDPEKPKWPMKLTVAQSDACFPIATWGFDNETYTMLHNNIGEMFRFSGVDIQKNPKGSDHTHPFGGLMSATPKTGTIHHGVMTRLTTDDPLVLRREVKWEKLSETLPLLEVSSPGSEHDERTMSKPKRRCLNGCRPTVTATFQYCLIDGSEHLLAESQVSETRTQEDDRVCPLCKQVPGEEFIFCSAADELVVHPGCEEYARRVLES